LNSHRDIIVTSIATSIATSTSDNLNEYDNLWTARFLYEGKDIANLKDKVHYFFILQREGNPYVDHWFG
jgi:hypothetical protein